MPAPLAAGLLLAAAYLVGSIPVGYLVGRSRGVNLFHEGSGNVGATNAGRVLGRKIGLLVFALDFLKGALPVAAIEPLARALDPVLPASLAVPHLLPVGAALAAFLGHLFPVFLAFRGGKGVATGAGAVAVLVPGPFVAAFAVWFLVVLTTRLVSLGSLIAAVALSAVRLLTTTNPFGRDAIGVTAFCLVGSLLVVWKHRSNIARLVSGTEHPIGEFAMRKPLVRVVHVLAVGIWFGGAGFFNYTAAGLFRTFEEVVASAPSDRTAGVPIVPPESDPVRKRAVEKNLARALAGAAVGPMFPAYFAMQAVCGIAAVATALTWLRADGGRRIHRVRVWVTAVGLLTVLLGSAISAVVSDLRVKRFDADGTVAAEAIRSFDTWHAVSLGLSFVTIVLAGVALALAAQLPRDEP
jgi:acyl-phosphate glycerol 3-phosphate acyltransferase